MCENLRESFRDISNETRLKVLRCVSQIALMNGGAAGNRVCQDWSNPFFIPEKYFNSAERDDLSFNYELVNSCGDDYTEGEDFFHDEMVVSFVMANEMQEIIKDYYRLQIENAQLKADLKNSL